MSVRPVSFVIHCANKMYKKAIYDFEKYSSSQELKQLTPEQLKDIGLVKQGAGKFVRETSDINRTIH